MNVIITIVLLVMAILSLQYNAFLFFGALVVAAVIASPRAWLYTVGAAAAMFLLKLGNFPSWDVLSFLVVGVAYGLMSKVEEKKEQQSQIPPELLYYYLMGGGARGAP